MPVSVNPLSASLMFGPLWDSEYSPSQHRTNTDYIHEPFDPEKRLRLLTALTRALKLPHIRPHFDGLICRGVSGLATAAPLADRLRVPLAVARKPNEAAHSRYRDGTIPEGVLAPRVLVVDDFVSTGATLLTIAEAARLGRTTIVGVCLYRGLPWVWLGPSKDLGRLAGKAPGYPGTVWQGRSTGARPPGWYR